jgi:hypothetical protein
MTWLILIACAAFFEAAADIVENENFYSSVFRKLNPKWWYKRESWKHARKIFGWKYDAWHVFQSARIILWTFAAVHYRPITPAWWWDVLLAGLLYNVLTSLSYKLLKT